MIWKIKKTGKYRIPVHRKTSPWIPRNSSNHKHHLVTINLARWRRTLSTFFFLRQTPTSKLDDEEKSTAVTEKKMKKTTLKTRRQKNEYEKKDDDSLLQKNVCLIIMTVSSIVVEYAFMKIINSTCYRQSAYST